MKLPGKIWRIAITGLAVIIFCLGAFIASLTLTLGLAVWPASAVIKRRFTRRTISRLARIYLHLLRCLRLVDFHFEHLDGLKQTGQLIVANHPTLLDAIFLMALVPHANFIVKAATTNNPFTARLVKLAGYIPNSYRGQDLIDRAVQALQQGQTLVVFPEGTRTSTPDQLVFQRGAANIALQANCLVQPVLIDCNPVTLRKQDKWYQVPERTPKYRLHAFDPLVVESCIDMRQPVSIQARALTRLLQNKFSSELQMRP